MMVAGNATEPNGNSGEPHRVKNATTKQSPSRGRAKLSSIMIGIIIVAVTLLWVTFLVWLAARMIA
jgi:hypothetical protein